MSNYTHNLSELFGNYASTQRDAANTQVLYNPEEAKFIAPLKALVVNGLIVAAKDYLSALRCNDKQEMQTIISELSDTSESAGWLIKAANAFFPGLLPDIVRALKTHPETVRQGLIANISRPGLLDKHDVEFAEKRRVYSAKRRARLKAEAAAKKAEAAAKKAEAAARTAEVIHVSHKSHLPNKKLLNISFSIQAADKETN